MGQVTIARDEAIQILMDFDNELEMDRVCMYADAFVEYQEAQANIEEHGAIVLHPRTGAPIPNPYSDVKARAMKTMLSLKLGDATGWLWDEFNERRSAPEAPHVP